MILIKNSIRQLFRVKGRTLLFFLLLAFASGLCSVGRSFLTINQEKTVAYEDSFMTIGTVEQKADSVQERMIWDAETKTYWLYNAAAYDSYVPLSVLDFEGADYLSVPEKRCFYGAYMPQYEMYGVGLKLNVIVEGSPVEDAVPDHPIKFKVTKVLAGQGILEGNVINLCDHRNPQPQQMYANKTYIMSVIDSQGHESEKEFEGDYVSEYVPDPVLGSTQVDAQGKKVPDEVPEDYFCEEVAEGFYESPRGKRWLNLIDSWDAVRHTFPVTGTNDLNLIMAFYNGNAYVSSGREFTKEEYERGDRVCIVPDSFAEKNGLGIGDQLTISLRYADHRWTPGRLFGSNSVTYLPLINAKGEIYPVFEEENYKIIGLYGGKGGWRDAYGLGYNEIIIPSRSVKNSDAENIIECGPMTGSTTSFRIANGKIDEYMEKWSRQGISNVEITFYDRGYTELEASINNMKYIARLLIVMGVVLVLLVLAYFSWLFILKQGERTVIERSLGLRKRQCFMSLFSGIFLIILLGSVCGCIAGSCLSGKIEEGIENKTYYDTTFGNSAALGVEDALEEELLEQAYPLQSAMQCILAITAAGSGIAAVGIWRNLRSEPMKMFAEIKRG